MRVSAAFSNLNVLDVELLQIRVHFRALCLGFGGQSFLAVQVLQERKGKERKDEANQANKDNRRKEKKREQMPNAHGSSLSLRRAS